MTTEKLLAARAAILDRLAGRATLHVFCGWMRFRGLPDDDSPEAGSHLWSIALRDLLREGLIERAKRGFGGSVRRGAHVPRQWVYRATVAGWALRHGMVLVDNPTYIGPR